jgi:hypothetical protein
MVILAHEVCVAGVVTVDGVELLPDEPHADKPTASEQKRTIFIITIKHFMRELLTNLIAD